jgi:hypothetical protein
MGCTKYDQGKNTYQPEKEKANKQGLKPLKTLGSSAVNVLLKAEPFRKKPRKFTSVNH